jgi:hypothetical protein
MPGGIAERGPGAGSSGMGSRDAPRESHHGKSPGVTAVWGNSHLRLKSGYLPEPPTLASGLAHIGL